MRLFHQLNETDQHNTIHYCMHLVIEDMLEDGVQLEPFSEEDKKIRSILEKTIEEALLLPKEEQFEFLINHKEAGSIIFDLSLDMARSAYYHSDDDLVIHYESLRGTEEKGETEELTNVEELTTLSQKDKHSLN